MVFTNSLSSYYEKFLATGEVKCIDEEIPFEIPKGWEWERWGNIALSIQYGYNAPALERGDIKMVRISDIHDNVVQWENVPFCNIEAYDIDTYLLKENDILFARTGGTVGKSFLVQSVPEPAIYAGYLIRTRYSKELCPQYLKSFMESRLYWEQLKSGTIATAQPNCNGKTLGKMLLPIPPKAEQSRLVQKLANFTPIFQRYAKAQQDLDNLNKSIDDKLKKSILQEAIQGRLVPQITEEGTAQELLEQIKQEKLHLLKEGKLKKSALVDSVIYKGDDNKYFEKNGKTEQDITDEIPFEIPNNWEWCRIGSVLNIWSARRVHEKDWRTSGIPFYRAREISKMADCGHVDNDLFIEQSLYDEFSKSGVPQIGDLMMTAVGTLGKTYVVETKNPFYYKDGSVLCIGNPFRLNPYYLKLFFESFAFTNQYLSESDGTTVATLTMVRLNRYLIPIPPLMEQTRIVEKIKAVTSIMSR
ncbi:restriction endonuclease subunit S [Bacteroides caccae]|uniref:restriction endonuclease subunit S n=1 Tax=Bacteroides caccae TaxID=47678 RepID=UPI003990C971